MRKSLPVRECGLKYLSNAPIIKPRTSLPVRECGLKSVSVSSGDAAMLVTPRAGVWIEIPVYGYYFRNGESLPVRECGLKYL